MSILAELFATSRLQTRYSGAMSSHDATFVTWSEKLYRRHTQQLTFQELRRSIAALSRIYTAQRQRLSAGEALAGRGKRAAFASFYAPMHYLLVRHAVHHFGLEQHLAAQSGTLVDLGCGTGVACAAWANSGLNQEGYARVLGLDVSSWALAEARHNWQWLGVTGQAKVARVHGATLQQCPQVAAVVAAFFINELADEVRADVLRSLLLAHKKGAAVLIIEPIARSFSPWWQDWQRAFNEAGGQEACLRMRPSLPSHMKLLSRAAGLDHRELTARCLALAPAAKAPCSKIDS